VRKPQATGRDTTGSEAVSRYAFGRVLLSVFLISLSVLAFEVALTRVFSVMLSYHFVFAIVSAAMLGLGVGGLVFKRWGTAVPERAVWLGAFAFSVSLAGSVILILTLPVYSSQALAGMRLWLYIALAIVPFGAAGFVMAGLFQRFAGKGSLVYGADLLGAATGALAIVPLMNALGAVNVIFLLAAIAMVGAFLLGLPRPWRYLPALGVGIVLAGILAGVVVSGADLAVPIANDSSKDLFNLLANPANRAQIVESRWSSFGRTDLVRIGSAGDSLWVFVDGAAGSQIYDLRALTSDPAQQMQFKMHSGESFPFLFLTDAQKRSALTIGPGGGRDVDVALLGGVKQITAVEVNPDVVKIVQQYKDLDGGIYSGRPGVAAIVGEGRNYVRTTNKRFDLIMVSIPVTKSSRSIEGYALTENNLFTVEALEDYLTHLTSDGRIIIVAHGDPEIAKLATLAIAAFSRQGLSESEAMKHIYTVGAAMMPAIVMQKKPLTGTEANAIHTKLHELGFDKGVLFVPWVRQQANAQGASMFDPSLVDVSSGARLMSSLQSAPSLDLRPPTDDRPFFYKFQRGLPSPFGAFTVLLVVALVAVVVGVLLPAKRGASALKFIGGLRRSPPLKMYLALFFALGIAYMLIEIAFFQKLMLYISQPQMALTILLFSLLVGGGIGSLLSHLVGPGRPLVGAVLSMCVAVLIVVLAPLFPRVFAAGLDPRVAAVILIVPLGVLMGCPFPLAVKGLNAHGLTRHTSVMWGVNGAASVLGSALAMIMGITWGFSRALLLGAVIYLGIAALFVVTARAKAGPAVS
jgi:spermidine synthase